MTKKEAIAVLRREIEPSVYEDEKSIAEALDMAIEALQDRPEGEWTKTVDGNGWNEWWVFKCPLCGAIIVDEQSRSWKYNFCPSCGARMRGEK
jgi:rubrerythrin